MKTYTRALWFVAAFLLMGTARAADVESEPGAILKKVTATYAAMKSYSAEGTIVADVESKGAKTLTETSFSITLKKPNLYLISWTQTTPAMPAVTQSGAVWNGGTQPYLYMNTRKAYARMGSDEMALGNATGISAGAALTVPSLFFPSLFTKQPATFSRLIDPQLEPSEPVDGDECYVISGRSTVSKKETFWISKKSFLIRQYRRSFEPPEGGVTIPQITDQQLEDSIKALGQEVTEKRKAALRKRMKRMEEAIKTADLKGNSTELHHKIGRSNATGKDFDFERKLPAGVVLRESLFGGP
jgi:hypothetical protein